MNGFSGNEAPHPLAAALIERLKSRPDARILEIGTGSGRNRRALLAAGYAVESYDTPPETGVFDAAISSLALLHGTRAGVASAVAAIAAHLDRDGLLYATFGSVRDARYGKGIAVAEHAFAPASGDETGVAHAYFDERALFEMLNGTFAIESLDEKRIDAIAGKWAHSRPLAGGVHFFLVARKRRIDA